VKTYIRTAYRKMGVQSRAQAVSWALQRGYPPDGSGPGAPHETPFGAPQPDHQAEVPDVG
jgi:hypothetical protein